MMMDGVIKNHIAVDVIVTNTASPVKAVDNNISYPAARRLYESGRDVGNYANITRAGKNKKISELQAKLDQTVATLSEKDSRIRNLEKAQSNNGGMAIAIEHGTIQDLIKEMDQLRKDAA